jgi:cytochrome c-type biogenesis protein CcmH/NrfG
MGSFDQGSSHDIDRRREYEEKRPMPNEIVQQEAGKAIWPAKQVCAMAALCLLVGLAVGYLFRGSQSLAPPVQEAIAAAPNAAPSNAPTRNAAPLGTGNHLPSLMDMKAMADKQAAPLLEKLKSDPHNKDLLLQVGQIYKSTHRFKEAAGYYGKAAQVDPKNVALRTELASCLYYDGDVDGAIGQLQQSLQYDPKDANSLFNLGVIKWQGKQDANGALVAWHELLKSNPQLSSDRKVAVQNMIAEVQKTGKS